MIARRFRERCESDDVTLPLLRLLPDMATRLDGSWHQPSWRCRLSRFWSSRAIRITALALGVFASSFVSTHLATRSARIPELPRASRQPVRVALVEPPMSGFTGDAASAATLLVAGNWVDAETAYRSLASLHPECPVFTVVARVLASKKNPDGGRP